MRIITGNYKGRNLFSVNGRGTRPTTAFNREAVFSMYQDYEGKKVLDLFAGTGSWGLEALSRGAIWADFVEFANPAIAALLQNIAKLGCGELCHVWRKRVDAFLKDAEDAWDLIFERGLLNPEGTVIVEHGALEPVSAQWSDRILKHKAGKTSSFTILN